jgi:large subunit ribosomal protein L3
MLTTVFATKLGMTQAWTKAGKRLPVTRCKVANNVVVGMQPTSKTDQTILEIGYGQKKMKNIPKPLRTRLERGGFNLGVAHVKGVTVVKADEADQVPVVGATIKAEEVLSVGDVVHVQGISKGRGFAGAMKRHGFHGGPRTHGQSDRARAVGSIGSGTTPGRVVKGKRMPGHFGVETMTVKGLVVVYIDPITQEVWLSGPVPGAQSGAIRIEKTGENRNVELLNMVAPQVTEETGTTSAEVELNSTEAETEVAAENQVAEEVELSSTEAKA